MPLVLSSSAGVILRLVDRMFLAWHSPESVAALTFVLFPSFFLGFFFRDVPADQAAPLMANGRVLLWYVATYCLLDGINVVFALGLVGAGDSWWISKMTLLLSAAAGLALVLLHWRGAGLYHYWLVATLFISACGATWIWRYRSSEWEGMKVIETVVVEKEAERSWDSTNN